MHLLLIHPPKRHQVWAGVPSVFSDRSAYIFPPLAVMTLSAYLKRETRHRVTVVDGVVDNLEYEEIGRLAARERPDVVGISASATHTLFNVRRCVEEVRRFSPGAFIVLGGPHVNAFPEQAARLRGVDAAIQGDGEEPLRLLLDALEARGDVAQVPGILIARPDGTVQRGPLSHPVEDLDLLPFPDREVCPPGRYYTPGMRGGLTTTMMSSRGCPNRCTFCNVPHRYRARSPEHVVDEIEECVRRYGIEDIHFVDDLFNSSSARVMSIAELILRRGIKVWWGYKASVRNTTREMLRLARRAGCYRVHYGVETYTDEGLRAMNKRSTVAEIKEVFALTREEGIKTIAYMIIAAPHEKSADDVLGVTRFMHELAPDYVVYALYTPYPDAPVFEEGVKRGLWPADCWERFMLEPTEVYDLPTVWDEHLSKTEQLELFKVVHRRFYYHPRTLLRTLSRLRTGAEVKRILLGGLQLARMELLRPGERRI